MKHMKIHMALTFILVFSLNTAHATSDTSLDWPGLYNPHRLLTLNLTLVDENLSGSNNDELETILNDPTFDIEVPAWFWVDTYDADGFPVESIADRILISVRRKSATAIPNESDPNKKVSYKLDINEFKNDPGGASQWHGIKKLSLENGDDMDVVTEGFAWYLHRLASNSDLDYQSGLAAWVKLIINGIDMGVYVNVEQPDKQFLKNRGMWEGSDDTWLYKMSSIYSPNAKKAPEDEFGDVIDSPASESLCYIPFKKRKACASLTPDYFITNLSSHINMEGMLTLGAVSAFTYSPDDLFSKGKNFYYVDYSDAKGIKREYMQWDLDSTFGSMDANADMYNQAKGKHDTYEESLVEATAPFREEYSTIINYLLNDLAAPFNEDALHSALEDFELLLETALIADANSKGAIDSFATLKEYVTARIGHMRCQLEDNCPEPPKKPGKGKP